jgi:hypothetical protein
MSAVAICRHFKRQLHTLSKQKHVVQLKYEQTVCTKKMSSKLLHVQASTQQSLRVGMDDIRKVASRVCGGIDDMHLLGYKALVIRAEIYPEKLPLLYAALTTVSVKVSSKKRPDEQSLKAGNQHPITLQISSFSNDTDDRVNIPKVPG